MVSLMERVCHGWRRVLCGLTSAATSLGLPMMFFVCGVRGVVWFVTMATSWTNKRTQTASLAGDVHSTELSEVKTTPLCGGRRDLMEDS